MLDTQIDARRMRVVPDEVLKPLSEFQIPLKPLARHRLYAIILCVQ